VKVGDLQ